MWVVDCDGAHDGLSDVTDDAGRFRLGSSYGRKEYVSSSSSVAVDAVARLRELGDADTPDTPDSAYEGGLGGAF